MNTQFLHGFKNLQSLKLAIRCIWLCSTLPLVLNLCWFAQLTSWWFNLHKTSQISFSETSIISFFMRAAIGTLMWHHKESSSIDSRKKWIMLTLSFPIINDSCSTICSNFLLGLEWQFIPYFGLYWLFPSFLS